MTRRDLFCLPGLLAAGVPAPAQPDGSSIPYRDYPRVLPDFLANLAAQAYGRRNAELARIAGPADARRRQQWARETFWRLIGGRPSPTPLNARTLGKFERSGYRVEKILYESRPNLHVPANLYIPTAFRPPFPGVLFQMGHTNNGKAGDTYQRCCQGLARLGYLVLAFDPMGQGERVYYPDASGQRTRLPSADDEHTLPGRQMLLAGDSATRMQVWDAVRSLDYLAAHPLVDPKRIGATGQSGGGTLTMLLAAVDDRVAAAVVCSGNTENVACAGFIPPGSTDDAEQDFVDSAPHAFDRWDTLYPFAPKPLLISISAKDYFGTYSPNYVLNGREEFQKLRRFYELLGRPEQLAWWETPLPHGLSYDTRLRVYDWFARWLKGDSRPVREEPPVSPEADEVLWVSRSGNVVADFHGETPRSLVQARLGSPAPAPLDRLLRVERPAPGLRATVLRRVPSRGLDIEALEIPSEAGVHLPAWLYVPRAADRSRPLLLALEPSGRNVRWHEGEMYQNLAAQGYCCAVPDVRGVGDLLPEYGRGNPHYQRAHEDEEDYAWGSLILGRPLVGQRVTDILAVAAALRAHPAASGRRLRLLASGRLAVPALFAAALDPHIDELYLSGGLVSFRGIVEIDEYAVSFAQFVPRLLLHTDLPAVAASMAPRRVVLAGAVNASGDTMDAAAVAREYAAARNVVVRPKPRWDADAFGERW